MKFLLPFILSTPAIAHDGSAPHAHPTDMVGMATVASVILIAAFALWARRA